ncbi:uncharacterized protein BDW43DRAFT_314090 [Aspergillus alliaceus]|uniref:uncharacterized protein n=1 Tax=Petromyces alliaceus TaxID=209559 RepID=UPI0012A702C0|nr:uncharacterized protein BDW43DRAFT_314090 [Aspergillus alliaceus]KAB8230413.1 hypothetical protein BDW43DRAFT_314090 [Aspergillus alliaceus]
MVQRHAPHIKFTENDRNPEAPRVGLKLELTPLLSCVLRRSTEDNQLRPFIFKWSPLDDGYRQNAFLLLRYTVSGALEKAPVPDVFDDLTMPECCKAQSISGFHSIQHLVPRGKYELLWLGAKLPLRNWGTPSDYFGVELRPDLERPDLIIPGGASVTFTYKNIETPISTHRISPPPVSLSALVPSAPVLSVELTCPSTVTREQDAFICLLVRYHGDPTD